MMLFSPDLFIYFWDHQITTVFEAFVFGLHFFEFLKGREAVAVHNRLM
jgi:hypothetical protein